MTAIRVLLVRHGQSEHNVSYRLSGQVDSKLTEVGVKQAQCLANFLSGREIVYIYSSDLQRAYNTALEISHKFKDVPVIKFREAREKDLGKLENLPFTEKDRILDRGFQSWRDYLFSSGENVEQFDARVNHFFKDIFLPITVQYLCQNSNSILPREKTIVLVSHGMFLSTLLKLLMNRFDNAYSQRFTWSNTGFYELRFALKENVMKTEILKRPNKYVSMTIEDYDCVSHLENHKSF